MMKIEVFWNMTPYLLVICYDVSEKFPASVFRVVEAETLNV